MLCYDIFLSSKPSGSGSRGKCVIAGPSPPRPFAAWRVEAFFFFLRRSALVVFSNCDLSVRMPDLVNSTPTNTARTELPSISHFTTRTRVAQGLNGSSLRLCASKTFCHPRVMSHFMPQLTLTTSTSSLSPFSPTSPIFPTVSSSRTSTMILDPYIPCDGHGRVADQHKSHLSQVMSPSRLRSKPSRPKRSSLKTSSPEELSLEGILGKIRMKSRKDF